MATQMGVTLSHDSSNHWDSFILDSLIEQYRRTLHMMFSEGKTLTHPEMIRKSQQLDRLIVARQRILHN